MQSVNEIVEAIHNLPRGEQEKVRRLLLDEERENEEKRKDVEEQIERYKKARKWLDEHSAEYINQWVCLEGDELIAHSADGRDLYQKAKEAGIKIPFIHHVIDESVPFGGW